MWLALGPGSNFLGAGDNDDYYILGNIFMKKYYTIFDFAKSRVGVIEAK